MKRILIFTAIVFLTISCNKTVEKEVAVKDQFHQPDSLVILWTSGDPDVFEKVVFPYGLNTKKQGWWKHTELLIWGPSTKLLADHKSLQKKVIQMGDEGIELTSCLWCADQYDATKTLREIGVDVKYMGKPLTDYLKKGRKVITF